MATQASSIRSDFYVYALFRENGVPFYIGKGKGNRWVHHEWEALRGTHGHKCNTIRGMQARGIEVIRVKLHEGLTEVVAHEYEVALIKAIGRHPEGPLANHTNGGDGVTGLRHTAEALAKMAAAKLGRKLTAESIAKRSAARRGKPRSPATIEKISVAQRGKPRRKMTTEEIMQRSASVLGSKRSPETRANMSSAQLRLGKKLSPKHRAQISAIQRGRKHTSEHIARAAAGRAGTKRTPESRERMRAAALIREAAKRAAKALLIADQGPHGIQADYRLECLDLPA